MFLLIIIIIAIPYGTAKSRPPNAVCLDPITIIPANISSHILVVVKICINLITHLCAMIALVCADFYTLSYSLRHFSTYVLN